MRKIFVVSLIPVMLFLVLSMVALPADAQISPKDSCTIERNISITIPLNATTEIIAIESETAAVTKTVVSSVEANIKGEVTTRTIPGGAITSNVVIDVVHRAVIVAKWGSICLINAVNNVIGWIFLFLLVISVALIAIAGFLWMTSGGDAKKTQTAMQMIVAAIIGIVIALLARVLPAVVLSILG